MLALENSPCLDHRVPDSAQMKAVSVARGRSGRAARAAGICLSIAAALALAQDDDPGDDSGHFEVSAARATLMGNVYYLDGRVALRLSTDARAALTSGFTLTIRLEIEILNRRGFWLDTEAATLTQIYELAYDALTERYIVHNVNVGERQSFGSEQTALERIGAVEHLPVIDAALLQPDRGYDIRARVLLDTEQLPGPLHLLAFWRRDWSLGSEWYRWQLAAE
jgi:hypothetical protein